MPARTVVVGFGVTGASAARQLLRGGARAAELAVVDTRSTVVEEAACLEIPAVCGDGTVRGILTRVVSGSTTSVIVTAGPDETAVMITMLARDLCPTAEVVTAVRDARLVRFVRQAGADQVLTTSDWAGRALALLLDQH